MKKLFVVALAAIFVLGIMVAIVYASGYVEPTTGIAPHGGYTTTTNRCKQCHAVHLATGSYRLLRAGATDAATACEYCHGPSGSGKANAYNIYLDTEGHGLSTAQKTGNVTAPDDVSTGEYSIAWQNWGCPQCHSVHDVNTVILNAQLEMSTSKLLKRNPNSSKATTAFYDPGITTTRSISQWCTNCHEANYGIHTQGKTTTAGTRYGHDVTAAGMSTTADGWAQVNPGDGVNKGPRCKQCHEATGTGESYGFPHKSGSTVDMLKSGTSSTQLDYVCAVGCHNTASLP